LGSAFRSSVFPLNVTGSREAFTLLELMVVLVLLSIVMAMSMPRFGNTIITDPLKRSVRQVIGAVREARQQAAESPEGCGLVVGLEAGSFDLYCPRFATSIETRQDDELADEETDTDDSLPEPSRLLSLPEPVRIRSVWNGASNRFTSGEVTLWITADGVMEPSVINLSDGSDELGLTIFPFIRDIRIDNSAMTPADYDGSEALL
jgi:prepilin-type N-terminal cleavage/methylation domain-containing protein